MRFIHWTVACVLHNIIAPLYWDQAVFSVTLLHVKQEFHSVKLICRNLYAIFSHVKKAYTANQNDVQLFSHVDV